MLVLCPVQGVPLMASRIRTVNILPSNLSQGYPGHTNWIGALRTAQREDTAQRTVFIAARVLLKFIIHQNDES